MTEITARLSAALGDRYTIERELGSGGMATVFLAADNKHGRHVAIKVLRPALAAVLGGERFIREIEIAARIEHPHILTLIDSGEAGDLLFYVMPYVDGESLRERVSVCGPLPIRDAIRMMRDVADGLAEAHRHGLVHRDIKPDNVMLSGNHAVVMDFGVAKALTSSTGSHNLTTAGIALGTPAYMSPEQVAADPNIDHRTDIYALGVMGYELLTGRPPFVGSSAQEVFAAHLTTEPDPVSQHRPDVPPALEALVMKCLAKKPDDRFLETDVLLSQLEALATPSGGLPSMRIQGVTGRLSRGWDRRRTLAVAAVGAVVLLGAFGLQRRSTSSALVASLLAAADSSDFDVVFSLLQRADRDLNSWGLSGVADRVGGVVRFETDPAGADVALSRLVALPDSTSPPFPIGSTPLDNVRLVAGEYQAKARAEGFATMIVSFDVGVGDTLVLQRGLVPSDWDAEGMVMVQAGPVPGPLADRFAGETLDAFLIDRYEVTNADYMQFVSDGGYRTLAFWPDSLLTDGGWTPRQDAVPRLVDRTGLAGPRDWSGGTFPPDRGTHPVSGVTWYEASAYAVWAGKSLPSVQQWWRAALGDSGDRFPWGDDFTSIDDRSNFSMVGVAAVGAFPFGVGPFGVYDMAGNLREWIDGDPEDERFVVLGGSWQDPTYVFDTPAVESFAPWFRSEAVGFRLIKPLPTP